MVAQRNNKWETRQSGLPCPSFSSNATNLLVMPSIVHVGPTGTQSRVWCDKNHVALPDGQLGYIKVTTSDGRKLQLGRYQPLGTANGSPVFTVILNMISGEDYPVNYRMFADQGNNVQFGIKSLSGAAPATYDLYMNGSYM